MTNTKKSLTFGSNMTDDEIIETTKTKIGIFVFWFAFFTGIISFSIMKIIGVCR